MASFKVSNLVQLQINSQDSTTGAVTVLGDDVSTSDTTLDVEISDNVQDVEQQTVFTVSRMTGELAILDYDALFVDTLNSGNTVEDEMVARNKIYVQIELEGGVMQDGNGNQWFEVRPVVMPTTAVESDEDLVKGMLTFNHSDFSGVQRPV
jgi:hypothetical protein